MSRSRVILELAGVLIAGVLYVFAAPAVSAVAVPTGWGSYTTAPTPVPTTPANPAVPSGSGSVAPTTPPTPAPTGASAPTGSSGWSTYNQNTPTATLTATLNAKGELDVPGATNASSQGAGLLGPFDAQDSRGVRISHYSMVFPDDGFVPDGALTAQKIMIGPTWAANQFVVGITAWAIDWSLDFGLLKIMVAPFSDLTTVLNTTVTDTQLGVLALMTGAVVACLMMLFRSASSGFGELMVTLVISALSIGVLLNPTQLLMGDDGAMHKARDFSLTIATMATSTSTASTGAPAPTADDVSKALSGSLVDTFVRQPSQALNFGRVLDDDKCLSVFDSAVSGQTTPDDNAFRSQMGGCDQALMTYNDKAGWMRVMGALFLLGATLIVAFLVVIAVVLPILLSQILIGFVVLLGVVALLVAQVPGRGRGALWAWVQSILWVLGLLITGVLFLAIFNVLVTNVLAVSSDEPMAVRFIIIDLIAIAALVFRRRLFNAVRDGTQRTQRRLERLKVGGTPSTWVRPPRTPQQRWNDTKRAVTDPLRPAHAALIGPRGRNGPAPGPDASRSARLVHSIRRTRVGRAGLATATITGRTGKAALKSTVGAPVYAPRAASRAKQAFSGSVARAKAKLRGGTRSAAAFTSEYTGNLRKASQPTRTVTRKAVRRVVQHHLQRKATTVAPTPESSRSEPPTRGIIPQPAPAEQTPQTVAAGRRRGSRRRPAEPVVAQSPRSTRPNSTGKPPSRRSQSAAPAPPRATAEATRKPTQPTPRPKPEAAAPRPKPAPKTRSASSSATAKPVVKPRPVVKPPAPAKIPTRPITPRTG